MAALTRRKVLLYAAALTLPNRLARYGRSSFEDSKLCI